MTGSRRADWLVLRPGNDDLDRRLDRILRRAVPALSLGEIYSALRRGQVRVNGAKARPERRLTEGDSIELSPRLAKAVYVDTVAAPSPSRPTLNVLFENDHFLVIDKPADRLVHGPDSLEMEVRQYLQDCLLPALSFRPGPLHRLDRNTSGVLFFSKSLKGAREFTAALRSGEVRKTYLAVLCGELHSQSIWTDELVRDKQARVTRAAPAGPSDAKQAISRVAPLAARNGFTLAEIGLDTGLTHQIRAQAALHGHPLAGDRKYGGQPLPAAFTRGAALPGAYLLHAWRYQAALGEGPSLSVSAPLPKNFATIVQALFDWISLE